MRLQLGCQHQLEVSGALLRLEDQLWEWLLCMAIGRRPLCSGITESLNLTKWSCLVDHSSIFATWKSTSPEGGVQDWSLTGLRLHKSQSLASPLIHWLSHTLKGRRTGLQFWRERYHRICGHVLNPWYLPWLYFSLAVGLRVFRVRHTLNDTHLTRLLGRFSEIPYMKKLWQILTSYAKVGHLGKSRETWGVSSGSSGKEPACLAGDTGDAGSIPGLGRCPGGGHGNPPSIVAWRIPWQRSLAVYSPSGRRIGHDWMFSSLFSTSFSFIRSPVWFRLEPFNLPLLEPIFNSLHLCTE